MTVAGCTICTAPRQPTPHAREQHPEKSVGSTEPEPSGCDLLEDGELVAEGYDLRFEFGPRSEAGPNCRKEGRDAWAHDWCTVQQKPVSSIATGCTGFSVGTG
jgi:hypothetical protein